MPSKQRPNGAAARRPGELGGPLSAVPSGGSGESTVTVIVAFAANLGIALAKSAAAALTGSASMLAEAAHSWADTGNQVLLIVANRRSLHPADAEHPLGYGREAYVWSLLAALGLFVAGAVISLGRGVQELTSPEPAGEFLVGYLVLGVSFVLEGVSFVRSLGQARHGAEALDRDVIEQVLATSDPTLRAVVAEDAAALIGLVIAGAGLAAHQATGSATPDGVGSILVGLVLGAVALVLIDRNREFLVGEEADPRIRAAILRALLEMPEVARLTYLRAEFVGPRMVSIVGRLDLAGDQAEREVAVVLRDLEARVSASPAVAGAVFGLSLSDEPTLVLENAA